MKIVKKIFEANKKYFVGDGKLKKLYPVFEAFESLAFSTKVVTTKAPHVRDNIDTKRYMFMVIVALIPILIFSIWNTGYQSQLSSGLATDLVSAFFKGALIVGPLIILSYTVGIFWEFLFCVVRKHELQEGFLVTGLLFPLILPPSIPWWQAALGISFGVVIGKEIFGGTGRNFLNPALVARAFLFFSFPTKMSGDKVWTFIWSKAGESVASVSQATPLGLAALVEGPQKIEAALTQAGFSFSKLFIGNYAGSIGETSTILILFSAIFLMVIGIASYRIIIGVILGAYGMAAFFNFIATPASSPLMSLSPVYHLMVGGLLFGAVFMATDPVSSPRMNASKWIYGIMIGVLVILVRTVNPAYPEGMMLTILFMNVFAPLIDYVVVARKIKKRIPNVV